MGILAQCYGVSTEGTTRRQVLTVGGGALIASGLLSGPDATVAAGIPRIGMNKIQPWSKEEV